MAILVILES